MRNLMADTLAGTCALLAVLTSLCDSATTAAEKRPRAPAAVAVDEVVVEEDGWDAETVGADPGCRVLEPCCGLPQGPLWCEADYLLWWTKGMEIPPLVTTGTTGALGAPDTRILYGDETILDDARSGFRVGLGSWFDCGRCSGLEGDYWMLGDATDHFRAASDSAGSPRLFRPFFNVNPRGADDDFDPPAREDAEIVSSPGVLAGAVDVDNYSQLQGAGLRFRRRLCGETSCSGGCDPCCQAIERTTRLDLLVGYRYVQLREGISIREDLTSLLSAPEQGNFDIVDQFGTTNSFNGADLGVTWRAQCGPWLVDILGKLALGGVRQTVLIDGQTVISGSLNDNGTYAGGLLAQRTNIGQHRRNVFAMIPELGVNLGYQLTPCLSAKIGYNFLYWSRVVRPGDEIDLDVNPDLLPPETEFAGAPRPSFEWRDTDYWAQGIRVGLEGVW
jgi:hypothetical protein